MACAFLKAKAMAGSLSINNRYIANSFESCACKLLALYSIDCCTVNNLANGKLFLAHSRIMPNHLLIQLKPFPPNTAPSSVLSSTPCLAANALLLRSRSCCLLSGIY